MPDGMSPENSKVEISPSVQALRQSGPTPEQIKEYQGPSEVIPPIGGDEPLPVIGGPEDLSVKLRMQIDSDDPSIPNREPGKGHEQEDEANSLKYNRRESFSDEMISGAETPQELYYGLRLMEEQEEESFIPPNLQERYNPPRQMSTMYERAKMLHFTIKELKDMGWIKSYDPVSGLATLKDRSYAALALKTEITDVPNGGYSRQEVKYYLGRTKEGDANSEEREILEKAYKRASMELAARQIIGEHLGLRLSIDVRDSLEKLTAYMHSGGVTKFKADHLEAIFNMPDVKELGNNPENRLLGDQVEEAMFLNLVMLNSGNKQRMIDFLDRPGSKHLMAKMAKEQGITFEQWQRENVGDVNAWVEDTDRLLDDKDNAGNPAKATWRVEADDGRRGKLTKWSNIAAWGGAPAEFSHDDEIAFIEGTVGKLVGSVEASWVAAAMMRSIGAYASEGYVALPNGKSLLPLGEGRFISGDDTGKFWAYMFNYKEGVKGRSSGLKDMIGKIPDMAMNLFDWAQVEVADVRGKDGKPVKRSIWDAWLGTKGGIKIKDLLTGTETNDETKEEPYHRLGDIDFKSLEREFHGTFTIMQWLMGNERGPTGVFIDAMKTDFRMEEDFTLNELKKKWKYVNIVMNPIILTKGSTHLYDLGGETEDKVETVDLNAEGFGTLKVHVIKSKTTETIQRRYFKNLMAARIRSSAFATDIMSQSKRIYNTGKVGDDLLEVPYANLINFYVKEVFKEYPKEEADIIAHYTDDLARLQKLTGWKQAGKSRDEALSWFSTQVGRVTGRKTS